LVVGQERLAAIPDVHQRFAMEPKPAWRISRAARACYRSAGLATAYPTIHMVGVDADPASIEAARRNADRARLLQPRPDPTNYPLRWVLLMRRSSKLTELTHVVSWLSNGLWAGTGRLPTSISTT
jgi:hypothetical protein